MDVRVNGVSRLSLTGQNTKNGTDNYHNVAVIGCSNYFVIADVYVLDNTGTLNNDFLGNVKVVPLLSLIHIFVLHKTDWVAYNGRKYAIENYEEYEFDAAYLITGKELAGESLGVAGSIVDLSAGDALALDFRAGGET